MGDVGESVVNYHIQFIMAFGTSKAVSLKMRDKLEWSATKTDVSRWLSNILERYFVVKFSYVF